MTRPTISIILPTYNRSEMLREALQTLTRQTTNGEFTYELIVIDNASTDDTKAVVEEAAFRSVVPVRYCYQPIPGPAAARNCGLAESQGQWLAFFDDDELAERDWLLHLFSAACETGARIVGGAVHLDLPREVLSRLNHFVRATSLREIDYYQTIHLYTGKRLPGTCNALVARDVFERVGAFDVNILSGGSDSDFFLRARAAGTALYYTPHAIVRHRVAPNRLTTEYFRWDAQQGCNAFASLDYTHKGRMRLAGRCIARSAHAVLVVLPLLVWAWLRRDPAEILGQRVRLWRAEGYLRRTVALLAPNWFPQHRYFAGLEFRRGRIVGSQAVSLQASKRQLTEA